MVGAIIGGLLVGIVFGMFRLTIPAPPTVSGLAGILALWAGYQLATYLTNIGRW